MPDMVMQPPYSASTKAGGFRFELDCERITQSDTWALADVHQRPLLLMLWFIAWQQVPCGSLPGEDTLIAARLGLDLDAFRQDKAILLRGWRSADDGRLYHPVVTELVLEMTGRKGREAQRKAAYRQRQREAGLSHGTPAGQTQEWRGTDMEATRESGGSDDTTTTTTTTTNESVPDGTDSHLVQPRGSRSLGVRDLVAEGVERQHAEDWLNARRAKRMPLTTTALDGVRREATKAGMTLPQAIERAAGEGWAGFKESWLHGDGRGGGVPELPPRHRQELKL